MSEKTILIKFANSDWFEVPVKAIAEHRADYYTEVDGFEKDSDEYDDEVNLLLTDPDEALDWVQNNMNWEDIEGLGEFVNASPFDYADGFLEADFEILKK